jgi:hypothetical protein
MVGAENAIVFGINTMVDDANTMVGEANTMVRVTNTMVSVAPSIRLLKGFDVRDVRRRPLAGMTYDEAS